MNYLVKIRPLEPYFLGTEQGFSDADMQTPADMQTSKKISYIATSGSVPSQTTILGVLRYLVLSAAGMAKADFSYSPEEKQRMARLIGRESFSFSSDGVQDFGVIREISPVFVMRGQQLLVPTPGCLAWDKADEPHEMKLGMELETSFGKIPLPEGREYNAKLGLCGNWYNLDTHRVERDIFSSALNTCNSSQDAFFKKEYYRMKEGCCFAVLLELEDSFPMPNSMVGKMGRGFSAFRFDFEPWAEETRNVGEILTQRVQEAFQNLEGSWDYALSDLVPKGGSPASRFCVVSKKAVRNIQTRLEEEKKMSVSACQVNLIQAGSVFLDKAPELRENGTQIGYNRIVRIGGKKEWKPAY